MEDGTSTEDVFEKKPVEETTETETTEETGVEPVEEDTSKKTEADSAKEALAETQALVKRYKEQVSGSQEEAEKLKTKIKELEAKIPPEKESLPELSAEEKSTRDYLKKIGFFPKDEVDKMIQDKVAPFHAKEEARNKGEQKRILAKFIQSKSDLGEIKDPEGIKMKQVLGKLRRITPADPFNPNDSLEEDLEWAYQKAFEGEVNQEALVKAKAEGRAEGHEASEAKVGAGTSAQSPASKRQRSSEQEEILKEWGVDDESYSKITEKK